MPVASALPHREGCTWCDTQQTTMPPAQGTGSTGWREQPETALTPGTASPNRHTGDREKLPGTSPAHGQQSWGCRTPCSGLGWLRGSRAGTFRGVPGLAPAHRQALRYVLVIRLQVQLPLHLQGTAIIRGTATTAAPLTPARWRAAARVPPRNPPMPRHSTAGFGSSLSPHERVRGGGGDGERPRAGAGRGRGEARHGPAPGRLPERQLGEGRARQVLRGAAWHGPAQPGWEWQVTAWHSAEQSREHRGVAWRGPVRPGPVYGPTPLGPVLRGSIYSPARYRAQPRQSPQGPGLRSPRPRAAPSPSQSRGLPAGGPARAVSARRRDGRVAAWRRAGGRRRRGGGRRRRPRAPRRRRR